MRAINDSVLLQQLKDLPIAAQSAFAQACAIRIGGIGDEPLPETANRLRATALKIASDFIQHGQIDRLAVRRVIQEFENLAELDDDRVASAAYVIRHIESEDPQEAIWAARRAHDAVDLLAQQDVEEFGPDSERALLAHQLVDSELECQALDLSLLQKSLDSAWEIARRAKPYIRSNKI